MTFKTDELGKIKKINLEMHEPITVKANFTKQVIDDEAEIVAETLWFKRANLMGTQELVGDMDKISPMNSRRRTFAASFELNIVDVVERCAKIMVVIAQNNDIKAKDKLINSIILRNIDDIITDLSKIKKSMLHESTAELSVNSGVKVGDGQKQNPVLKLIAQGEVITAAELANAWDLTPQALGPAAARGEIIALIHKRARYYPKEFMELNRSDVADVCKALKPLSDAEIFIFWKRPHGALNGDTVAQCLKMNNNAIRERVLRLAQSWAKQAITNENQTT